MLDADLGGPAELGVALPGRHGVVLVRFRVQRFPVADHLEDVGLVLPLPYRCGTTRHAPVLEPGHQPLRVVPGDERALDALGLRLARRDEEHVAVA